MPRSRVLFIIHLCPRSLALVLALKASGRGPDGYGTQGTSDRECLHLDVLCDKRGLMRMCNLMDVCSNFAHLQAAESCTTRQTSHHRMNDLWRREGGNKRVQEEKRRCMHGRSAGHLRGPLCRRRCSRAPALVPPHPAAGTHQAAAFELEARQGQ